MKPSPSSKVKKTQDEMSAEIASFAAKRKEALERAEKLREERKALQRHREVALSDVELGGFYFQN